MPSKGPHNRQVGECDATALGARMHLESLCAERALALASGVAPDPALDARIEWAREHYVGSAVTEIATLRGELFGRQLG
jgi:hypothetical protein